MHPVEVAIIGAGPIGIELAIALKRRGISFLQFDARQIGQTMFWWPPGTRWFSSNERIAIAGVPLQTLDQSKATREEYLRYLRSVVEQFDLRINTYEPVTAIERCDEGFHLTTDPQRGRQAYLARRVVLATGGTARPRTLGVPGEGLPHVSHLMEDPHKYFRKRILVVGGKNSAVEAALRCHQAGAQVTLSYRRSALPARSIKYWLYPEITGLIKSGKIVAHFNTAVTRITPGGATLAHCGEDLVFAPEPPIEVEADFILLQIGYIADMSLAHLAGVILQGENQVPTFDPNTMETNIPGLFIAGTAVGGTQDRYRVFLENCHIHVDRIVNAVLGLPPPVEPAPVQAPET